MREVYIIHGARTPFTRFGGSFSELSATEMGAHTAKAALERAKVSPEMIDHVVYGNVIHTSTNAAYLSRHIALKAGVPKEVPALTLNRLCGSGMQAVISGMHMIQVGEAELVLAGGAENMSQSPYSNFQERFSKRKMGDVRYSDMLQATLYDEYIGCGMGVTAENLASAYTISQKEQDEYTVRSHVRASEAQRTGVFAEEIVSIELKKRNKTQIIKEDEHIRPDINLNDLTQLKPVFKVDGTVTAANSSGINDGASSLIIASKEAVVKYGLKPLVKIVSTSTVGVDPAKMGIGPVPAIKEALRRANVSLEEMDRIEVNEAFASQVLAVGKALNLDLDKTNVYGGAIALGHPVGASGARLLLSSALELNRYDLNYAVASLCIGGGQGIATVIQRVEEDSLRLS